MNFRSLLPALLLSTSRQFPRGRGARALKKPFVFWSKPGNSEIPNELTKKYDLLMGGESDDSRFNILDGRFLNKYPQAAEQFLNEIEAVSQQIKFDLTQLNLSGRFNFKHFLKTPQSIVDKYKRKIVNKGKEDEFPFEQFLKESPDIIRTTLRSDYDQYHSDIIKTVKQLKALGYCFDPLQENDQDYFSFMNEDEKEKIPEDIKELLKDVEYCPTHSHKLIAHKDGQQRVEMQFKYNAGAKSISATHADKWTHRMYTRIRDIKRILTSDQDLGIKSDPKLIEELEQLQQAKKEIYEKSVPPAFNVDDVTKLVESLNK